MNNDNEQVAVGREQQKSSAREMLRLDYGIDSAFVRVPQLARVLGLAECTIYAAMRHGRFFMPHRMLMSSPAVKIDDLVAWYCDDGESVGSPTVSKAEVGADRPSRDEVEHFRRRIVGACAGRKR